MTFKNFRRGIELYIKNDSSKIRHLILDYTNRAILEFARMDEWERIKVVETITLDGSEEYTLDNTNLNNNYGMILSILNSDGVEYDKYDYVTWLGLEEQDYTYAIVGDKIYVTGDSGDLTILMTTPGLFTTYPITSADLTVEPRVFSYYQEILEKMVIVKILEYQEDERVVYEKNELARLIFETKRHENRLRNEGKIHTIRR